MQRQRPVSARAAGTRTVSYRGYTIRVPAGWPVINLDVHPRTCVRFDRHALYLGRPGASESCPARLIGATEAMLDVYVRRPML